MSACMLMEVLEYFNFWSGWVVEGHVVELNVSFDPVQLVPGLRQTVNLRLLAWTHLERDDYQ